MDEYFGRRRKYVGEKLISARFRAIVIRLTFLEIMMNKNRKTALAIVATAALAGAAYATTTDENDARLALSTTTTLGQAVAIAEQHVKGRAARAELESSDGKLIYEVEVVTSSKVFDIHINATNGTVEKVSEDANDDDISD